MNKRQPAHDVCFMRRVLYHCATTTARHISSYSNELQPRRQNASFVSIEKRKNLNFEILATLKNVSSPSELMTLTWETFVSFRNGEILDSKLLFIILIISRYFPTKGPKMFMILMPDEPWASGQSGCLWRKRTWVQFQLRPNVFSLLGYKEVGIKWIQTR